MSKHKPKPWQDFINYKKEPVKFPLFRENADRAEEWVCYTVEFEKSETWVFMTRKLIGHCDPHQRHHQFVKHGKLMASAPDLLSLLNRAVTHLIHPNDTVIKADLIEEIQQAIAKAEGKDNE